MVAAARAVVCLSLWLAMCQVRGADIPMRMNKTIQSLLKSYTIKDKDRFDGKLVFSRKPVTSKMEAKWVYLGGVLETYEKLIDRMLSQLPTQSPQTAGSEERLASAITPAAGTASDAEMGAGEDVRTDLNYILKTVRNLRKHLYPQQDEYLHDLRALKHIQMDDLVVQSKALWELPWLYKEASSLSDAIERQRRRRRRQTRRDKMNLRG